MRSSNVTFFDASGSFKLLCGTDLIQLHMNDLGEVHHDWREEVKQFKITRKKYLLYEDFE